MATRYFVFFFLNKCPQLARIPSVILCICTDLFLLYSQLFIKELVWNLFGEGNDVFKEGEWTKSIEMYTEALSVAEYADSEEICVPTDLLEKLYANRAAAYLNIVPVSRRCLSYFMIFPVAVLITLTSF